MILNGAIERHNANPYRAHLKLEKIQCELTYNESRGVEEINIIKYKTLNRLNQMNNQIHGISPKNPKYDMYMEAGAAAMGETYVGGIKW